MSTPHYLILDVDDVLIDTDTAEIHARTGLGEALAELFDDDLARSIQDDFFRRWDFIVDWQQGRAQVLVARRHARRRPRGELRRALS